MIAEISKHNLDLSYVCSVRGKAMQKWEYLYVTCEFANEEWRPSWVNGQKFGDWKKGPTHYEFSNHLGEYGWEMVSSSIVYSAPWVLGTYHLDADNLRLVFKRPKP